MVIPSKYQYVHTKTSRELPERGLQYSMKPWHTAFTERLSSLMMKLLGLILLLVGTSAAALAFAPPFAPPEISPASGASAIALLAGALLVVRGRRK